MQYKMLWMLTLKNTKKRMRICFIHSTSLRFAITNQIGKKAFYGLSSLFSPLKT